MMLLKRTGLESKNTYLFKTEKSILMTIQKIIFYLLMEEKMF
jgi:hypothetical protein